MLSTMYYNHDHDSLECAIGIEQVKNHRLILRKDMTDISQWRLTLQVSNHSFHVLMYM
jgi:hypothetical protein